MEFKTCEEYIINDYIRLKNENKKLKEEINTLKEDASISAVGYDVLNETLMSKFSNFLSTNTIYTINDFNNYLNEEYEIMEDELKGVM